MNGSDKYVPYTVFQRLNCHNIWIPPLAKWVDLRVKFSPLSTGVGLNSFWPVEKTLDAALAAGWVRVNTVNSLGATTLCLTSDDVRVCPMYDAQGFFAGLQMAVRIVHIMCILSH